MAAADLVAPAALNRGVVVVKVVELELHDLDLRILRKNLLQHLRTVVEGNADMPNFSLLLEGKGGLIGAVLLKIVKFIGILRMHQVKVEVFHPAGGKLRLEKRANLRLGLKEGARQLIR